MMTTSTLLRAPRDIGSWMWFPRHAEPGPAGQYALAAAIADIAARHRLLTARRVVSAWRLDDVVVPRVQSTVDIAGPLLNAPRTLAAVVAARPAELPERAEPGAMELTGPGTWFDADGTAHTQEGLLRVTVDLPVDDAWVNLEVFHDVWMPCDFTGRPHPGVHRHNAPRLAAAITDISTLFGAEAEPGEPTYFGHTVGLGVENSSDDGTALDVTDLIASAAERFGG